MQITTQRLQEFKKLYKEEFGKELTDKEAFPQLQMLLGYVKIGMEGAAEHEREKREHLDKEGLFGKVIFPNEYSKFSRVYAVYDYDVEFFIHMVLKNREGFDIAPFENAVFLPTGLNRIEV